MSWLERLDDAISALERIAKALETIERYLGAQIISTQRKEES